MLPGRVTPNAPHPAQNSRPGSITRPAREFRQTLPGPRRNAFPAKNSPPTGRGSQTAPRPSGGQRSCPPPKTQGRFRVHNERHCNASAILSTGGNEKDVMEGWGLKTKKMVGTGSCAMTEREKRRREFPASLPVRNKRRTYGGQQTKKPSSLTAFSFWHSSNLMFFKRKLVELRGIEPRTS